MARGLYIFSDSAGTNLGGCIAVKDVLKGFSHGKICKKYVINPESVHASAHKDIVRLFLSSPSVLGADPCG